MAPWIPRMHLFEIDDQPWFPSFLRAHVQAGLMHAWTMKLPLLQSCSPASIVVSTIRRVLSERAVSQYTYIDFCAGAGGPTPAIERELNEQLALARRHTSSSTSSSSVGEDDDKKQQQHPATNGSTNGNTPSYATIAARPPTRDPNAPVNFVLTDLFPNLPAWKSAASKSSHLTFVPEPIDASCIPADLIARYTSGPDKKIFRLFNLAFHHFDDPLARAILRDTLRTSDALGIFELQNRSISSFVSCLLFGLFIFLIAPFLYWWSPTILIWVYIIPVVPFVLVFDGIVSSLRTRTADEVETLLRTCAPVDATRDWVVISGQERFLWPCGYLSWVIAVKRGQEPNGV